MTVQGLKRGRPSAEGKAAKRCKMVADAVSAADVLPGSVIKMLGATVHGSIGVPPDERDGYQKAFVDMLESLLKRQEAAIKSHVQEEESKADAASSALAAFYTETKQLEDALAAKEEDIKGKEQKLSQDTAAEHACSSLLQAATKAQASLRAEIDKMKSEQEAFEKLNTEHFKVIRDDPPAHRASVRKHIGVIEKAIAPLKLDEALIAGVPLSLVKKPDERGTFDQMLIDYLATIIDGQVEKCQSSIAGTAEDAAAHAAAVEAAQRAADGAKAQLSTSSEALAAASVEKKELQAKIKEAQKKAKEQAKGVKQTEHDRKDAQGSLTDFGEILAAFALQRDGEAAPAEEVPQA